ncbi:MAG TPA: hypothetical protein VIK77_13825 [Tissierellaceae bacterium]
MKRIVSVTLILLMLITAITASKVSAQNPNQRGYIEGYFVEAKDDSIVIESYDGVIYSIPMIRGIRLEIDGRLVNISDFKRGMEVYIELQGRNAVYMDAYSASIPGYIEPGTKTRIGTVSSIDRDQIKIMLPTGREEVYFTSPATVVLKNKQSSNLNELYVGDRVKLYFDDINTSYISRIEIEGDSVLIKDLYRGKISLIDKYQDVVVLENVEVFRNGSWKSLIQSLKLPYNGDIPIYVGGQKIDNKNLQYYKGRTAYMAIKDFFGKEKIEKMVVKSQYENTFSEKIDEINWFSSQMELANNKNISFTEGTMVIKSGRLVDIYSLNPGSDGLIVADGLGSDLTANIIYIYNEDINNSNIGQDYLYAGRLNTILEDRVYLKDFFILNKNKWESFSEEKELYYDEDTFIYDLENGKEVSPKEFFSSKYSVDEKNKDKTSRDWYGYIYTNGDRISAVYLKKSMDSLLAQRVTTGVVESKPVDDQLMGWVLILRDSKDWSNLYEQWMAKNSSINIYLRDAMIIKNGKHISIEDIKAGDRLYLIRDDNMAKVIIVK